MSFEEAFAAGSSPSWFLALPTDVKNYLHTYSGFGGVATAVGNFESVNSGASTGSRSGAATMTGSKATSTTSASGTMESAGAQSTMPAQSPSSGGMRSTGSLVLALAGAVGVLGVAIAL